MVSLCITSFMFFTTVVHAFYMGNAFYHHLMLCVTLLSVAFHHHRLSTEIKDTATKPDLQLLYFKTLRVVDKVAAHVAFIIFTVEILNSIDEEGDRLWLLVFPVLIALLWYLECGSKYDTALHISLHISCIIAVHFIIRGDDLGNQSPPKLPFFH